MIEDTTDDCYQAMSDRLALSNAIEEAGIPRDKAQELATAIARFVEGSAATRSDVEGVGHQVALLRSDVQTALATLSRDLTWRGLVGLVSWVTILFGLLHLWPPHP